MRRPPKLAVHLAWGLGFSGGFRVLARSFRNTNIKKKKKGTHTHTHNLINYAKGIEGLWENEKLCGVIVMMYC